LPGEVADLWSAEAGYRVRERVMRWCKRFFSDGHAMASRSSPRPTIPTAMAREWRELVPVALSDEPLEVEVDDVAPDEPAVTVRAAVAWSIWEESLTRTR